MDCHEALDWLEAAELNAAGLDTDPEVEAEIVAARRHLTACPACQAEWPVRRAWALSLTAAMSAVPVPETLHDRLTASLPMADAPSRAAENVGAAPARRRSSARPLFRMTLALLLLAALTPVAFWWWQPPVVRLSELYVADHAPALELPAFRGPFEPRLPSGWTAVFTLDQQFVKGFPGHGAAAGQVALVPFQMSTRNGPEPLRGRLLILRRQQLQDVESLALASDFAAAEVRYLPESHGAYVAWAEDDLVFVCLMSSGPADLHRFMRTLQGSRALT